MTTPAYCPRCGSAVPPGARFCPGCGADFAPPPAPAPQRQRTHAWWIVGIPLAILAILLIAWAVLAGMPFGNRDEQIQTVSRSDTSETIGEGSQSSTDTVTSIGESPQQPQPQPQPPAPAAQPPVVVETNTNPPMASATPPPAAPAPPQQKEMSEDQAVAQLRNMLTSDNPYPVAANCLTFSSLGERNRGYTIEVRDDCSDDSELLGRWRVDALTGEVFRQNQDGRYVRP